MAYILCLVCKALDLEHAVLHPDPIPRASLGALEEICRRSNECALCDFISKVPLASEKGPYTCFLSFPSKVEKVVSTEFDLSSQSIYYYDIILEFQDANQLYENNFTLEPCCGIVPACKDTISEDKLSIPWMSPRAMEPLVPLELIKSWIHTCEDGHGEICASPPWVADIKWPQSLRLIDVKRNCIVYMHEKTNYVALSYVWGTTPETLTNARASKANLQSMQVVGSLLEIYLPKTIREAMALVHDLGETYLWVDCLCVIQDDPTDLAIQIPQVGLHFFGNVGVEDSRLHFPPHLSSFTFLFWTIY